MVFDTDMIATMAKRPTLTEAPDLFSGRREPFLPPVRQSSSTQKPQTPKSPASPSHLLTPNLENSLQQLTDHDFERLVTAVFNEHKRRGKPAAQPGKISRKSRTEANPPSLTIGQLNAVRAAFRAGVKPSQIARQFRISKADISKALLSDPKRGFRK